jgi:hypothetical protein
MDPTIQPALITALAAVMGSLVGGLASFATTFFTQRYQARRDLLLRDAANRKELSSQFIKEAANLYIDSLGRTLENPASLIGMYSLWSTCKPTPSGRPVCASWSWKCAGTLHNFRVRVTPWQPLP